MKSFLIALGVFALVLVGGISWGIGVNNQLVGLDEGVSQSWSQVENVYQRRLDLIPNLVATVKGYAKHEAETLEKVVAERAKVGRVEINNPEALKQFQAKQGELSSALSRLMVVSEQYPDLKANQNFRDLQAQLEGTENRITVERMRFTEAVKAYNTTIRKFPASLIASFRNMKEKPYFDAKEGADVAPKVEF